MEKTKLAVEILQDLIDNNQLKSTTNEYVEKTFRNRADGRSDTWYAKSLVSKGLETTEAEMNDWINRQHLREFSEAIKPIAVGIMNLAKRDTEGKCVTVATPENMPHDISSRVGAGGSMVVAIIPEWQGCGCELPEGGSIFSQYGSIHLRAIVIGVSVKKEVVLGLMFKSSEFGVTFITIERDGNSHRTTLTPRLNVNGVLLNSLGLIQREDVYSVMLMSGGRMSEYLDFPDSDIYLAKHIGKLGPYLIGMAEHMAKHN